MRELGDGTFPTLFAENDNRIGPMPPLPFWTPGRKGYLAGTISGLVVAAVLFWVF